MSRRRIAYSGIGIAAAIALVSIVYSANGIWRVVRIRRNISEISEVQNAAMALLLWQETNGGLPPRTINIESMEGRHTHSWRSLLLKNVGDELTSQYDFNKSWDSEANAIIGQQSHRGFGNGSSTNERVPSNATVIAVEGAGTALSQTGVKLKDLPGNLIVLMSSKRADIQLFEPRDISLEEIDSNSTATLAGIVKASEVVVFFADGETWLIDANIPNKVFRKLLTAIDAEAADREELLGPWILDRVGR